MNTFIPGKYRRLLKPKELLFVIHYCANGFNAQQAYVSAGYAKNSNGYTRLLKSPYILRAINHVLDRALANRGAKLDDILAKYNAVMNAAVTDFFDFDYENQSLKLKDLNTLPRSLLQCIKSIKQDKDGSFSLTLESKSDARRDVAKYLKMFNDTSIVVDKSQNSATFGIHFHGMTEEEQKDLLKLVAEENGGNPTGDIRKLFQRQPIILDSGSEPETDSNFRGGDEEY